jgi:hypothetical protein
MNYVEKIKIFLKRESVLLVPGNVSLKSHDSQIFLYGCKLCFFDYFRSRSGSDTVASTSERKSSSNSSSDDEEKPSSSTK